jgi:hypothetical protein
MGQVPQQSASRSFKVIAKDGDFEVNATSVSVDEAGYLSFYKREDGATGFLPVAGFPSGSWTVWMALDG